MVDLFKWCAVWLCLLTLVVVASGCSDGRLPTHTVRGQLEFEDGTTPMFGDVEFYNSEHKLNARGKVNRDGSFTVGTYEDEDGAVLGQHEIVIIQQTGNYLTASMAVEIAHDHGELIHSDYFDYRTSDLKCTIEEGDNELNFVLRKR